MDEQATPSLDTPETTTEAAPGATEPVAPRGAQPGPPARPRPAGSARPAGGRPAGGRPAAGRGRGGNPLKSTPRRSSQQRWARKLHTWISMFGLILMLFFGATGFVLNHSDWSWGTSPVTTKNTGTLPAAYLNPVDVETIATYLRGQQFVFGAVTSQSTSGTSLMIATTGPGATSSVTVDTSTGAFTASKTMNGFIWFLTDLHRGNSVGTEWGWVVDASAWGLILISLTGLAIGLLNRSRHWSRDMLLAGSGLAVAVILLFLSAPRG